MDKQGRLFGKISVVDICVVLLALAIIGGTAYRFMPREMLNAESGTLRYTIKINGVRSFTYQYYGEGQLCQDQKTGQQIGRITAVRQEPYHEEGIMADGTVIAPEKPDVIIVYVDVEASGSQTRSAYFANGTYEIKVGSEIHLATKYIDVTGLVEAVSLTNIDSRALGTN